MLQTLFWRGWLFDKIQLCVTLGYHFLHFQVVTTKVMHWFKKTLEPSHKLESLVFQGVKNIVKNCDNNA